MTPALSVYLDLVRIVAAFLVLLAHTNLRSLSADVPLASGFGHSAVVVFFVLSGFVISYIVARRENSARVYAISRCARIYSVLIPALLLALVLDRWGASFAPATYAGQTTTDWTLVRVVAALTMMNEPWGISIQTLSGPFWSISYEGWYYILFGVFTFWVGPYRSLAIAAAVLLAGPKVLLLMPIWFAGVYLHRGAIWQRLQPGPAVVLYIASLAAIAGFHWYGGPAFFREIVGRLVGQEFQWNYMTWSGEFLGDYLLGALVMLNFAAFRAAGPSLARPVLAAATPIRWAAGFTFSLYLFHRPLLLFYTASIAGDVHGQRFYFQVVGLTLVSVYVLGLFTEHKKEWFRSQTERVFAAVERAARRLARPDAIAEAGR